MTWELRRAGAGLIMPRGTISNSTISHSFTGRGGVGGGGGKGAGKTAGTPGTPAGTGAPGVPAVTPDVSPG
jgi:hypothetical protein